MERFRGDRYTLSFFVNLSTQKWLKVPCPWTHPVPNLLFCLNALVKVIADFCISNVRQYCTLIKANLKKAIIDISLTHREAHNKIAYALQKCAFHSLLICFCTTITNKIIYSNHRVQSTGDIYTACLPA